MVTFLNFQVLKVWFTNHLIVQLHVVAVLVIYYSCCCNDKTLLDIYLSSFSVSIPHFTGGEPHFSGCYYTLAVENLNQKILQILLYVAQCLMKSFGVICLYIQQLNVVCGTEPRFLTSKYLIFFLNWKLFVPFYSEVENLQPCCIIIKHIFMHLQEIIDEWDSQKLDQACQMETLETI